MDKSLKTFLVDGDKGGVGKSLTTRAIVHHLMNRADRPLVALFDADMSNPDVGGTGGLTTANSSLAASEIIDLSIDYGWIQFGDAIERLTGEAQEQDRELRIVVNMPAQIGTRAFRGELIVVPETMRNANAIPVWLLSRTDESILTLADRIRYMPQRFAKGLAVRNLFFGMPGKFARWDKSALRTQLLGQGWLEANLPEINDEVISRIGRTPFHVALEKGIDGQTLLFGSRLVVTSWLNETKGLLDALEGIDMDTGTWNDNGQ